MSIEALRTRDYPPGEIRLQQVISKWPTYTSYLMTHDSDGLQLTGVATLPTGTGPFPVVILNHGFILPGNFETGDGTQALSHALATRGYITLASDYRRMGLSRSSGKVHFGVRLEFAVDVLNLVASVESLPEARHGTIGMWGHSMGADLALRAAEVNPAIGPLALWAPLSGWMDDISSYYRLPTSTQSTELRAALSPGNYLHHLRGPVEIHQGADDTVVQPEWARKLHRALLGADVSSELILHPRLGHHLDQKSQHAVDQMAGFFNRHLGSRGES